MLRKFSLLILLKLCAYLFANMPAKLLIVHEFKQKKVHMHYTCVYNYTAHAHPSCAYPHTDIYMCMHTYTYTDYTPIIHTHTYKCIHVHANLYVYVDLILSHMIHIHYINHMPHVSQMSLDKKCYHIFNVCHR